MKSNRCSKLSGSPFAGALYLSLALVTLLSLSPVGFAISPAKVSSPKFGAHALDMPPASLASVIQVNTTGDGDNVNANAGCDADAATSGEQCTLRAAIQRANALVGDDNITIDIPVSNTGGCSIMVTFAETRTTRPTIISMVTTFGSRS